MFQLALLFLVIMLIDGMIGFTGIIAAAAEMAALLFYIFVFLLTLSLLTALRNEWKPPAIRSER
jgi:uncharacterized membrane protein YtjA (UPF0391 family)